MPRSRGPILLAALVAAALLGSACSTAVVGEPAADPAPAPTAGPGADPTAWIDRACGGLLALTGPLTAAPDFGQANDLAAVQRTYGDYLTAAVSGVEEARTTLAELGASPVPGGDAALGTVRSGVDALQQQIQAVQAAVSGADPANLDGFVATVQQAEQTLRGVTVPDVVGAVAGIPRLARAAERAPRCQQVGKLAAIAPR